MADDAKRKNQIDKDRQTATIPIVEETAVITKREVASGKVTVRSVVEHDEELVSAVLTQQDILVERVPVDREITEIPEVREVDGVQIIPVVDEILVVEKRLLLREEIHIRKHEVNVDVEETVKVRSMKVEIDKE